jgi:hypothetical protein
VGTPPAVLVGNEMCDQCDSRNTSSAFRSHLIRSHERSAQEGKVRPANRSRWVRACGRTGAGDGLGEGSG